MSVCIPWWSPRVLWWLVRSHNCHTGRVQMRTAGTKEGFLAESESSSDLWPYLWSFISDRVLVFRKQFFSRFSKSWTFNVLLAAQVRRQRQFPNTGIFSFSSSVRRTCWMPQSDLSAFLITFNAIIFSKKQSSHVTNCSLNWLYFLI